MGESTRRAIQWAFLVLGLVIFRPGVGNELEPADTIYHGGDILTMASDAPEYVEAIAIRDGVIVFAGAYADAMSLKGKRTVLRDLSGRTLMPGFVDAYGQFMSVVDRFNQANVARPPLGKVTSLAVLLETLKGFQDKAKLKRDDWVVGWGLDTSAFTDAPSVTIAVTRKDLDKAFPDTPVVLILAAGQSALLNTAAMKQAGLLQKNGEVLPAAEKGSVFGRVKPEGELSGLVSGNAFQTLKEALPRPPLTQRLRLMSVAQKQYTSQGFTLAVAGDVSMTDLTYLQKAASEQRILMDIVVMPRLEDISQWHAQPGMAFGKYQNGLKFQGATLTLDGAVQDEMVWLTQSSDWNGPKRHGDEQVEKWVKQARQAEVQLFVQANGDAAIDQALKAIKQAGFKAKEDKRPVVISSLFQRPDQTGLYREYGVSPSYSSNTLFYWGDALEARLGEKAVEALNPLQSSSRSDLKMAIYSGVMAMPLSPFQSIWSAMQRKTHTDKALGSAQKIDVYTALQAMTSGPAWQLFDENRIGRIQVGMKANLVELSQNPLKTPVQSIRGIKVLQTIKENAIIYRAK